MWFTSTKKVECSLVKGEIESEGHLVYGPYLHSSLQCSRCSSLNLFACVQCYPCNHVWDGPIKNPSTCIEDGPLDVTFWCTCTKEMFIPLHRSLCTPFF